MSKLAVAERFLSAALSVATVVGVGVLVEGRLSMRSQQPGRPRIEKISDWERISEHSVSTVSGVRRSVDVVTFTDFECPMCRIADSLLTALIERNPQSVSRSIVSFPLPSHAHAMAAAIAFECASAQGRASNMHEQLYKSTADFADSPWKKLARDSGVPDSVLFAGCLTAEVSKTRVMAGLALGKSLRISGTPAFVVNGTLFDAAPFEVVERAVLDAVGSPLITKF